MTQLARAKRGPIFKHRVKGDFAIVLEYWNLTPDDPSADWVPCMRICAPKDIDKDRGAVLGMDQAFLFADGKTGHEARFGARILGEACEHLGWARMPYHMRRLATAILDNIEDLFGMPPYVPPPKVLGEVTMSVGGEKITRELTT